MHPSLQYFIGNTPGKADEGVIKKVLERCAVPLLQPEEDPLVIEQVQSLTKEQNPRTRCWRVVVPFKFKALMENCMLYPDGWRYREFIGNYRPPNIASKKMRMNGNNVVEQVMGELGNVQQDQVRDQQLQNLQKEILLLRQQQSRQQGGNGHQDVNGQQGTSASAPPGQLA